MKLAVIPARGGSQRIPKKNIKLFCGKPILAYSISAARASGLFDEIMVSTDDAEIAAVALEYGAHVPYLRPADLADAYTGTNAVTRHVVAWYIEQGMIPVSVCCLYATAPFVLPADLQEGYARLCTQQTAFVFSVTTFPFPIQRALHVDDLGRVAPMFPEHAQRRSQDLEEAFHDAGQFYWGRAEAFLQDVPLYSEASAVVRLPRHRVQDIDTLEDWQRAELMYQALQLQAALRP